MRRENQIAIVLGLATLPCGAWLAVATDYLHLKGLALTITYWGGFGLTAALIILALVLALRAETETPPKGHRKRMLAIIGMAVCGFGFVAFASLYLSNRPTQDSSVEEPAFRPFGNLRSEQLREQIVMVATGLRQLQTEYNNLKSQLSNDFYQRRRLAATDAEKTAIFDAERVAQIALGNEMESQFREKFRTNAIMLREELRARLKGELPLPSFQRFPNVPAIPADTQIFDKPILTGPDPLYEGADLLEYWAKLLH